MAATVNVATGDATGTGIWDELTTVAATTMRMDTAAATTMAATTTATCRPITTVRHSTAGPTIRGPRRWFTPGVGVERRGTDTTATTSIPIPLTPPPHCG